jgi:chromate reductase, NAD(P)H dehydrogenase (quinone)
MRNNSPELGVPVFVNQEASIRVLAISGSLRIESSNSALINAAMRLAPADVAVSIYVGLSALPPFNPDHDIEHAPAAVTHLRSEVQAHEAVLISSPEYAHGVPGVLKNALDWLVSSGELIDKPVALVNASARATHAWNALAETLAVMSARVVPDASITVPLDGRRLDPEGIVADAAVSSALKSVLVALAAASRETRTSNHWD